MNYEEVKPAINPSEHHETEQICMLSIFLFLHAKICFLSLYVIIKVNNISNIIAVGCDR